MATTRSQLSLQFNVNGSSEKREPLVVCYGTGRDSTALLVGMKTTATTEAVSSSPGENRHWNTKWRRKTSCAEQKPVVGWKNELQIQGEGGKSRKLPTPFVGIKPYGKCQVRLGTVILILMASTKQKIKDAFFGLRLDFAAMLGLFLALPIATQAQLYTNSYGIWGYQTNADGMTLNVTSYSGSNAVVTIPNLIEGLPVTGMADFTFAGCSSLADLTIPEGVTNIGDWIFPGCISLTNVTLPVGVTAIEDDTFNGCQSLASVNIPETVTSIGPLAFYNCFDLANVTIPNNVTNIGSLAFCFCTSLVKIRIPNGIVSIEGNTFSSCSGLTCVTLPNTLATIGDGAFSSCTSLTNITLPDGVTSIGEGAFDWCISLTNFTIPGGVTVIKDEAFENCTGLKYIVVPNGVTNIEDNTFYDCINLTNVTLPDSVTSIGNNAFNFCPSLTGIKIPNSVVSIGSWAFAGCSSLVEITIPKGVSNIADYAFAGCSDLTSMYFDGNAPGIDPTSFNNDSLTVYYLPGTTGWDEFALLAGVPTVLWNPQAQTDDGGFGVKSSQFGFNITGTTNIPIVVEASASLGGTWVPLQSLILTNGSFYFSDSQWINYPRRFYRFVSP